MSSIGRRAALRVPPTMTALLLMLAIGAAALAQPAPPVRVIAEWEPAIGTLISWPLGVPQSLVVELAEDEMLFVLVTGPGAEAQARSTFDAWSIDPAHVEFITCPVQTHWPRDWGPHQVFDGDGVWSIVDPIFEGYPWVPTPCEPITSPGGHAGDDHVPIDVAEHFEAPLLTFPGYLTGGNFLVDGHAAAFSTCAMVGENQQLWTEAQFLDLAQQWLGVSDYVIVNNTEDYGIQHIDCWMKPLDEETLLVKRPPVWHEEYDRIEENLDIIAGWLNCYGRPYRIVRIDCPPYDGYNVAAYTNSLILNGKVLVPLFNIPGDAEAIATFSAAMPGYEIIGLPWGSWYYYDALHCRTRAIFDRHMLRVTHRRMDEEVPYAEAHEVVALIDDRSEEGLIDEELLVYHRAAGSPTWDAALLTPTGETDVYAGAIPAYLPGTIIQYYISAADHSGRHETLPRTAPGGHYSFTIIHIGFTITAVDPPLVVAPAQETTFQVTIDPAGETIIAGSELLHWRYDGGAFLTAPLVPQERGLYLATLPAPQCADAPEFYLSAESVQSGVKTDPPGAPDDLYSAAVGELVPTTLLVERFEDGLPASWSTTGLWHVTDACAVEGACDPLHWAYFGLDGPCTYDNGAHVLGELTSDIIELPELAPGGSIILSYCSNLETENEPGYDVVALYVNGELVDVPAESPVWETRLVDLSAFAGGPAVLQWSFDSIDHHYNGYHGWQVDAITITYDELCCDECPADVNGDTVVDVLDLLAVIAAWGNPSGPEDINNDGIVNVLDLLAVIAAWGPC